MEQEKLIKYITGNLDKTEEPKITEWINSDQANKDEFVKLKNLYALSSSEKHFIKIEDDFLELTQKINNGPNATKSYKFGQLLKYAAILVFALFIGFSVSELRYARPSFGKDEQANEFYAPEGQISEFKLIDGTKVWLNSGTRIRIPESFSTKNRIITMEGEAFFQVTKDQLHPFYVNTKELSVKVMGTSFNVSAYESDQNSEVTLIEGKVGIKEIDGERLAKLLPGQQFILEKSTGRKIKREVDITPFEAWRDGKMIFKDRTLEYIAQRLERWYNVEIDFNDQNISQIKFTGTILKSKPLSQVLDIITLSAPIRFEIKVKSDKKNQVILYSLKTNKKMM
jgi:Fe2+-dicitrate sensor, membrane component